MKLALLIASFLGVQDSIETRFQQVHPAGRLAMERMPGRTRAVVLIHGLAFHPLNKAKASEPRLHDWQQPGSVLVKTLAKDSDVFSFAYTQNTRVENVAQASALASAVSKLKYLGYGEIVLLGHSTGGVIARLFVEDNERSGVTRVIQVCAPNDGAGFAQWNLPVAREQEIFLSSLTKKQRLLSGELREACRIPSQVDFVCVVGAAAANGDGILSCKSQWPMDLQKQGIPAVRLATTHLTVLRSQKTVDKIADLVREPQPRWSADKVEAMRKSILGTP